jgi:hypothetical protein
MAPRDQGRWGVVRPGLTPTPYTQHAIPFPFKHISFPIVTYLLFLLRPRLLNTHDPASCTLVRLHCCIIGVCLLYLVTLVVFIEYYRTNQVFFIFVIADIKPRNQVPGVCLYIAGNWTPDLSNEHSSKLRGSLLLHCKSARHLQLIFTIHHLPTLDPAYPSSSPSTQSTTKYS